MRLVVLDSYAVAADDLSFDPFASLAQLSVYPRTAPEEIAERIGNAELVITNKCTIDRAVLEQCPSLRYIGVTATGYNIIDLEACSERGIVVTNVPDYSTKAVAQQVFAYLLHYCNKIDRHHRRVMAGEWQNAKNFCFYETGLMELQGKTIGLIGFGHIAKQVAKLALAFDMKVLVSTRTVRQEDRAQFPFVEFVSFSELLKQSDFVSIHCPLTPQTQGMFCKEQFEQMKSTAVLLNTARGPVLCEQDLKEALDQGQISAAYVDVVSQEPIRPDNPLLTAKNICITPHTAWAPRETRQRLLDIVYDNLAGFLKGEIQNQVK